MEWRCAFIPISYILVIFVLIMLLSRTTNLAALLIAIKRLWLTVTHAIFPKYVRNLPYSGNSRHLF